MGPDSACQPVLEATTIMAKHPMKLACVVYRFARAVVIAARKGEGKLKFQDGKRNRSRNVGVKGLTTRPTGTRQECSWPTSTAEASRNPTNVERNVERYVESECRRR